jgi:hypothetical protein
MKMNEWTEKMYEIWCGLGHICSLYRVKYASAISGMY